MDPITIALGLAQVVPSIVKWIAGDDAGEIAQKAVDVAKGVTGAATGDSALSAINSNPDIALRFKTAWMEHEAAIYAAETERLKVSLADTDSARRREADVKDLTPRVLAFVVTLGFFGLLALMMFREIPASSKEILNIMTGALGAGWASMLAYYYGSSQANDRRGLSK